MVAVKRGATDLTYLLIGGVGLAALGAFAYYVYVEFMGVNSPGRIYDRTVATLKASDTICDYFGTPLVAFGEETRRGRRRCAWKC